MEMQNPDNIEMKTEISGVLPASILKMIATFFKSKNFDAAASYLNEFLEMYFKLMVSKNRKGRIEILNTLQNKMESYQENKKDIFENLAKE